MRVGENTSKEKLINVSLCQHRVIIPLYIPHENEYYKDSFSVFKLCIQSLIKTVNSPVKISVISNGSCYKVNERLMDLYKKEFINELVIERDAIGKLNSILKVMRTCDEPFVTISDADILFNNNWEKEVMMVFKNFPKASAVSPIPVFRTQNHYTANIIFDYFFSKRLRFSKVKDPKALTLFAKSVGWSRLDEKWKDFIMTIESKNKIKAVVGCNHCIVTYKNEIFKSIPTENSKYKLGGNSEGEYLDKPSTFYDGYRLATYGNFAFHIGNKIEPWMLRVFNNLEAHPKKQIIIKTPILKKSLLKYFLKHVVFKKLLFKKNVRKRFYVWKGLIPERVNDFF